ncbi:MAG: 50S ribosomal protein L4 [Verrucomicrobiota bacterium]
MSAVKIFNTAGESVGEYGWPDELLELQKGAQAVRDVVVAHRTACRAGTASTLSKGEVAGSNKKPWRQKGLGRARAGYKQSPLWRGGAVAFGPKPGIRKLKVNKKVAALAFRRILSERISSDRVKIIDKLSGLEMKTRNITGLLKTLQVGEKALIVATGGNHGLKKAVGNLRGVRLASADDVSTFDIIESPLLIATQEAMDILKRRAGGETGAEGEKK